MLGFFFFITTILDQRIMISILYVALSLNNRNAENHHVFQVTAMQCMLRSHDMYTLHLLYILTGKLRLRVTAEP